MFRKPLFSILACVALATVSVSCSKFDERWDNTPALTTANPSALMVGKWEGTWQSDVSDYGGDLQAIITAAGVTVDDKKTVQQYTADLRFKFQRIGFDEFTVTFNAVKTEHKRLHFFGRKDLGHLKGGVMRFEGFIDPERDIFYLDYFSGKDSGTYLMQRKVLENL